jgi:hypothetical protein
MNSQNFHRFVDLFNKTSTQFELQFQHKQLFHLKTVCNFLQKLILDRTFIGRRAINNYQNNQYHSKNTSCHCASNKAVVLHPINESTIALYSSQRCSLTSRCHGVDKSSSTRLDKVLISETNTRNHSGVKFEPGIEL